MLSVLQLVFVMTVVPTTQQVSGNSNSSAIKRHRATRFVVDFTLGAATGIAITGMDRLSATASA